jgi:hypothetical protein
MIVAINRACVDLNAAATKQHVAPALQFVCGLGPRKADTLLSHLRSDFRGGLMNRDQVWPVSRPGTEAKAASCLLHCAGFDGFSHRLRCSWWHCVGLGPKLRHLRRASCSSTPTRTDSM